MQPSIVDSPASEVARLQLLKLFEQNRRDLDRGRHERLRYSPMHCRIVGVRGVDELMLETTFADWDGAARPSWGSYGVGLRDPATIRDVWPTLTVVSEAGRPAEWRVDKRGPVRLAVALHRSTQVDVLSPVAGALRLHHDGSLVNWRHPGAGFGIGLAIEAGPIRVRYLDEEIDANAKPWRQARPATPWIDLPEAERKRQRDAAATAAWDAEIGYARLTARRRALAEFDEREKRERDDLAEWEIEAKRTCPRSLGLDRDLLAVRFPDGLTLHDNC